MRRRRRRRREEERRRRREDTRLRSGRGGDDRGRRQQLGQPGWGSRVVHPGWINFPLQCTTFDAGGCFINMP